MLHLARPRFVALSLVALLTFGSLGADAQTKPFEVIGVGIAPDGVPTVPNVAAPHWAIGVATSLGFYEGQGHLQLLAYTGPTTANFSSAPDFTFTGANGDKLAFTYGDTKNGAKKAGEVTLTIVGATDQGAPIVTAKFVAEFNPVLAKCTGRFAKVTGGSFIMTAETEPFVFGSTDPVEYAWAGKGTLTYGK